MQRESVIVWEATIPQTLGSKLLSLSSGYISLANTICISCKGEQLFQPSYKIRECPECRWWLRRLQQLIKHTHQTREASYEARIMFKRNVCVDEEECLSPENWDWIFDNEDTQSMENKIQVEKQRRNVKNGGQRRHESRGNRFETYGSRRVKAERGLVSCGVDAIDVNGSKASELRTIASKDIHVWPQRDKHYSHSFTQCLKDIRYRLSAIEAGIRKIDAKHDALMEGLAHKENKCNMENINGGRNQKSMCKFVQKNTNKSDGRCNMYNRESIIGSKGACDRKHILSPRTPVQKRRIESLKVAADAYNESASSSMGNENEMVICKRPMAGKATETGKDKECYDVKVSRTTTPPTKQLKRLESRLFDEDEEQDAKQMKHICSQNFNEDERQELEKSSKLASKRDESSSSSLIFLGANELGTTAHKDRSGMRQYNSTEGNPAQNQAAKRIDVHNLSHSTRVRILDHLLDPQLTQTATLVSIWGQFATRDEFRSFLPKGWLKCGVINCYYAMLTVNARLDKGNTPLNIWYLPTWFQQFSGCKEPDIENLYSFYLRPDRFGGPINSCQKICIPMNWENKHWYLFVVDMVEKIIHIYDSKPSKKWNFQRLSDVMQVRDMLHKALAFGFGDDYLVDVSSFPCVSPTWCPQQDNKWDCGMYAIQFMKLCNEMKSGVAIQFNSEKARCEAALELFLSSVNLSRDENLMKWGITDI